MDTKININGTEYITLETYNILMEELQMAKRENPIPEKRKSLINPENVMALFHIKNEYIDKDIIELYDFDRSFKLIGNAEENLGLFRLSEDKLVTENNTKIGKEYYKKAKAICLNLKNDKFPLLYQAYDKEKKEILKDFPLLIVSDNVGIMIAPRVENN